MIKKRVVSSQWESQKILKSPLMRAFDVVSYLKKLQEVSKEDFGELIKTVASFLSFMDDEKHLQFRKVLTKPMSSHAMGSYQQGIQKSVVQVLDHFVLEENPDLVKHFTDPLYIKLLDNVFGLQIEDTSSFLQDIATSTRITEPMLSLRELKQVQETLIRLKRIVETNVSDHHASGLLKDVYESGREALDEEELIILLTTLVIASRTTTESLICILCEYGKLDQERRDRMLSNVWIQNNIDHLIRFCASTKYLTRVATESVSFGALHVEKDELVVIDVPKANRDAAFFGSSTAFHEEPSAQHAHIAFGGGTHICPGAHMARVVISHVVPAFFARVSSFECNEENVTYQLSTFAQRPTSCPITMPLSHESC